MLAENMPGLQYTFIAAVWGKYIVFAFTSPNELSWTWKQTRRAIIPNKSKIRQLCFVFSN